MCKHDPGHREDNPFLVHTAFCLDSLIREWAGIDPNGLKAAWLADQLGISPGCLSNYRSGARPVPAYVFVMVDNLLKTHRLLSGMAKLERCGVFETGTDEVSIEDLESLHELVQRTHGQADAELTKALRDHKIDQDERAIVHPLAAKMRRFWQDIEERTMPSAERVAA